MVAAYRTVCHGGAAQGTVDTSIGQIVIGLGWSAPEMDAILAGIRSGSDQIKDEAASGW